MCGGRPEPSFDAPELGAGLRVEPIELQTALGIVTGSTGGKFLGQFAPFALDFTLQAVRSNIADFL